MYELSVFDNFSSAHALRGYEGACENLHGHNWKVEAFVQAEKLGPLGMAIDFKALKAELKKITNGFDHKFLNDLPEFSVENPTAENIARMIFERLSKSINDGNVTVSKVRVWESETSSASYWG